MRSKLKNFLVPKKEPVAEDAADITDMKNPILREDQQERLNHDMSILHEDGGSGEERLQKEAEKEIRSAAEHSLKKLHAIRRGRCPQCGEHLRQHLFASICDTCGWHTFEVPRTGRIRVHLSDSDKMIEGERCYVLKTGDVLVIEKDVVSARIPAKSVSWVEYVWNDEEINQRQKEVLDRTSIPCGWCNNAADPDSEGFHVVHVAFGSTQERYCFCSDQCREAFIKMYPTRVHRNCYESNCSECNLCIKRYSDRTDGVNTIAKDYLSAWRKSQA